MARKKSKKEPNGFGVEKDLATLKARMHFTGVDLGVLEFQEVWGCPYCLWCHRELLGIGPFTSGCCSYLKGGFGPTWMGNACQQWAPIYK